MDSYNDLGTIVDEYIIERGSDTRHNYSRLLNIAIRGLKQMTYDISGTPTYEILELDANGRADVPKGMVKLIQMSFMTNGGLVPIAPTDTKNPWTLNTQGEDVRPVTESLPSTADATAYDTYFAPDIAAARWKNGEFIGHVFAGGGGNPFTYLHNYDTNKFEFSSNVSGTIVAEILKNPQLINGKFKVHPYIEDVLLKFIYHRDINMKKSIPIAEKERARRDYYAAKNWARMQLFSKSKDDIRNAQRKHYSLTIS